MRFCRTPCLAAMAFVFLCAMPLAAQSVSQSGLQALSGRAGEGLDLLNPEQNVPVRLEDAYVLKINVGETPALAGHTGKGLDLRNLEQNVPVRLEDAYVLPANVGEAYVSINPAWNDYETWWQTEAAVAWGLPGRTQAVLGVTLKHSKMNQLGNGDLQAKLLRQFHDRPGQDAALCGIEFNLPTGQNYARLDGSVPPYQFMIDPRRRQIDLALLGVWTKVLDRDHSQRLHLEARHDFVNSAGAMMRSGRWSFATAYDRLITDNTLAVANVWWQEAPHDLDASSAALQLGVRHRESDRFLWGSSIAVGLGWQDASWGLGLSGEYQFTP